VPQRRIRALALKRTKLGEADLIVTFLAEDGCQVRAVAKGARKTGSRFGARVEPFAVVDLMLHEGRTLDVITDVQTVTSHAPLREDYDRASAGSVVADFLDKVSVECQTEDRLFALAEATLAAMEQAEIRALPLLVVAFLLKGMAMHGYRPQFGSCALCGGGPGDGARFSLEHGGPVCEACAGGAEVVRMTPPARALLASLMGARMAEVATREVPAPLLAEAMAVVRAFVVYHVPARLKALAMYGATLER
jgi:DNA repair protein RecO (recombination protein O)